MKKKEKYSLTSQQRKQKRIKGQVTNEPEKKLEDLSEEEQAEIAAKQAEQRAKTKRFTRLVAVILAAVLAIGLITTGTVLYFINNSIDNNEVDPVATIKLSDGRELKVDLFYSKAPAIVANFIYLAENGFYDQTVFNATSGEFGGFLCMGGYTTDNYKHRSKDIEFVSSLKGFTDHSVSQSGKNLFKLSYRLKYVDNDPGETSREGHMAFMSGALNNYSSAYATATSYMFIGKNVKTLQYGSSSTNITNAVTYMGRLTAESLAVVKEIMALEVTIKDSNTYWYYANPSTYPNLKIENITISKLNRKLKNKILNNFESYVLGSGEGTLDGFGAWDSSYKADRYFPN